MEGRAQGGHLGRLEDKIYGECINLWRDLEDLGRLYAM